MNRLGKILTLGLAEKRAWQLPIIAGLLVLFGLGVRWWYNSRAAKGVRLLDMVDINDVEGVRWICRWDREQVNEEGEVTAVLRHTKQLYTFKYSPLFLAVKKGYARAVKVMLNAGDDVNPKDAHGRTPLHFAAIHGQTEVVKILLKAGAEVNANEEPGWTPLHLAAYRGHTEMAKLLLEAGAEVNAKDERGRTPLHNAAYWGLIELAKTLINAGAKVNTKDNDGKTPLDKTKDRESWINPKDQAKCAQLLRKHGAKTGAELDAETGAKAKQRKGKEQ